MDGRNQVYVVLVNLDFVRRPLAGVQLRQLLLPMLKLAVLLLLSALRAARGRRQRSKRATPTHDLPSSAKVHFSR